MSATRSSLLRRVRNLEDRAGWCEFDQLYRPMLVGYARRRGLSGDAAEEIAQQCLTAIVGRIQRFRRQKSFRGWLRRMTDHKVADYLRQEKRHRAAPGCDVEDAEATTSSGLWMEQWDRSHIEFLMAALREELAEHTVRAFEMYVVQERPVEEISQLLSMTANQIYVAKSRVLARLREPRFAELVSGLYGDGG